MPASVLAVSLLAAEDKEMGSVSWAVYGRYVRCLGLVLACVVVLGLLAGEAAYLAADWWLALWAAEEPEQQAEPRCAGRLGCHVCMGHALRKRRCSRYEVVANCSGRKASWQGRE